MERVQFQQEQMLAELKDLVQKGLFTQQEVKQIVKRRTAFETALVRRIAKKNDYLRYAAYEMGLEALRQKRVERLKLPQTVPSISDYALVRRQFHIFERALKKFKSDVALWIQYIQVAKKEGARSLVGRITARALQLHPNVPALYILAASHELSHLSPSAARTLLQRGIRMNAESVEMWSEYVKMEMGFVESMRRRWGVLGIEVKGKEKARESLENGMNEDEVAQMQTEADGEGDEAEQARREIMQGAIVKSVISNGVKAIPKTELFTALHRLLTTYPAPEIFREGLLDYLHTLLRDTLPTDPTAIRLTTTRKLAPGIGGVQLVDALREANETLTKSVEEASKMSAKAADEMGSAYAQFIEEWVQKPTLDDALKAYLLTSLHNLIRHLTKNGVAPPSLLSTHLSLLATQRGLVSQLPYTKVVPGLPKRYTAFPEAKANRKVWIARLEFEKAYSGLEGALSTDVYTTWKEARASVQGEGVLDVWTWGIPSEESIDSEEKAQTSLQLLEMLLGDSMRMQDAPSFRIVHDRLLCEAAWAMKYLDAATARSSCFRRLCSVNLPDAQVYKAFFLSEASLSPPDVSEVVLKEVYNMWRRRDAVDAALAWAGWLVRKGRGREASEVVSSARAEVAGRNEQRQQLEDGWRAVLASIEQDGAKDDEDAEMADA